MEMQKQNLSRKDGFMDFGLKFVGAGIAGAASLQWDNVGFFQWFAIDWIDHVLFDDLVDTFLCHNTSTEKCG